MQKNESKFSISTKPYEMHTYATSIDNIDLIDVITYLNCNINNNNVRITASWCNRQWVIFIDIASGCRPTYTLRIQYWSFMCKNSPIRGIRTLPLDIWWYYKLATDDLIILCELVFEYETHSERENNFV